MVPADSSTDSDQLARQLWALGDPVRLRLIALLPAEPNCGTAMNVSRIAEALELSQPAASHHLRVLRQAGLIRNRKMCRDMIYWRDLDAIHAVAGELSQVAIGPDARN